MCSLLFASYVLPLAFFFNVPVLSTIMFLPKFNNFYLRQWKRKKQDKKQGKKQEIKNALLNLNLV